MIQNQVIALLITGSYLYWQLSTLVGFLFSADEPTALVQVDGGPCAVIAPVQAFILKNLLFGTECKYTEWKTVTGYFCD